MVRRASTVDYWDGESGGVTAPELTRATQATAVSCSS